MKAVLSELKGTKSRSQFNRFRFTIKKNILSNFVDRMFLRFEGVGESH